MIEIVDLAKTFADGTAAVRGVSLAVGPGELYCLLGPNGAGKSTTLHLLLDFLRPTSGVMRIDGIDVARSPWETKQHVAYVPEVVSLYGLLRVRQNLKFFAGLAGHSSMTDEDLISTIERAGLSVDVLNKRVRELSKGMRQKLTLAIALLKEAGNLVLDEPTSGLDPRAAQDLLGRLGTLRHEGKAILMSTHDIFRARSVATKIGIMRRGRIVREIEPQTLGEGDLERLYLAEIGPRVVTAGDQRGSHDR